MKLLEELSWPEIQDYLAKDDRILLPLGAIEEHGRHLGVGTDAILAEAIARESGNATGVMVAPTLDYGMSLAQMCFPGTLSLKPATMIAVIEDILEALYRQGFRRVVIVNGHGGNTASISCAVQTVALRLEGLRVKLFEWWTDAEVDELVTEELGEQVGSHAADAETALLQAVRPKAVKLELLSGKDSPVPHSREITTIQTFRTVYPDGIMGAHPSNASAEAGQRLLKKSVEICVAELAGWK